MASGELVGTIIVAAGGEEDMYLLGLPAGTYVLVDPTSRARSQP